MSPDVEARDLIELRPFAEADLWLVDRASTDPAFGGPYDWFGFQSSADTRRRWDEDRLLGRSPRSLCVALVEGGAPVGWVNWRDTERAGPGVFEIGVLIDPDYRRRGFGTASQALLVDYLFSTTQVHRIWAGTEIMNIAEQKALERCGFQQEGLLRGHHYRDGEWRDAYIYGLVRPDVRT